MDIICYSHLRWNFVYQRPQHLLSRMAKHFRVFFIEEPFFDAEKAYLDNQLNEDKVWVIVPHLQPGLSPTDATAQENALLKKFFDYIECTSFIAWYYTPMALNLNPSLQPALVIYDCMDELSAFKNAPPVLKENETALLERADIVFTGGFSLYEAKKGQHHNIFLFPSSIDRKHFGKARLANTEMSDQENIPHPRIGFFGVIDERMDIALLAEMAEKKPDYHFVIIGPTVKIDPATLPQHANIHYLGSKTYKELPLYISKWDVAMMPFAINESTRFISPTKTPEYLASGKPVVSTPIHDVIHSYGDTGMVYIADTADKFLEGVQSALDIKGMEKWLKAVDAALSQQSWDTTVEKMMYHINTALEDVKSTLKKKENELA